MAKLTFVVRFSAKKLQGNQRVKVWLRVSHLSSTRYLDTNITVGCHLSNGVVCPNMLNGFVTTHEVYYEEINSNLAKMLRDYHRRLELIANPAALSVNDIVNILSQVSCNAATLQAWGEDYAQHSKKSYAAMVRLTIRYWNEWLCNDCTRLSAITPETIKGFEEYLRNRQKKVQPCKKKMTWDRLRQKVARMKVEPTLMSDASVQKSLAHIKAILHRAADAGAVRYDVNPFAKTKIGRAKAKRCEIEPEDLLKLRRAILPGMQFIRARDMWMLSFFTGGMNLCDIMSVDWSGKSVIFQRQKTRDRTREDFVIPIIPEAREIVDRYMGPDGRLDLGLTKENANSNIGKCLRKIRDRWDLSSNFCFYSARHTFAQCCLNMGVPDSITNYLMAHSDNRGIISSYSRVSPRIAGKVLRRLMDYVRHPEKYEDAIIDNMFKFA